MKHIYTAALLPLLLLAVLPAQSQRIVGHVTRHSSEPIPFATAILMTADSTIVGSTLGTAQGRFNLRTARTGAHIVRVQTLGYVPSDLNVTLPTTDTLRFTLTEKRENIEAVRIQAKRGGVRVQGDTIAYNVRTFSDGTERVLGDVLNKLPEVTVSKTGQVSAQGERVGKILFDGKALFGNDVKSATQHVSADVVDSVQVIRGHTEFDALKGFVKSDAPVINVGVKQSAWGRVSGLIEAAGGYRNRYDGKANAMYLGSELMVMLCGSGNNAGSSTLSREDYDRFLGGGDEANSMRTIRSGVAYRSSSSVESRLLNPPEDRKYLRAEMAGINLSYIPNQKLKLQAFAIGHHAYSEQWRRELRRYWDGERTHTQRDLNEHGHLLFSQFKADYSPTESLTLQYTGRLNINDGAQRGLHDESYRRHTPVLARERSGEGTLNFTQRILALFRRGRCLTTGEVTHGLGRGRKRYAVDGNRPLYPSLFGGAYTFGNELSQRWTTSLQVAESRLSQSYLFREGWSIDAGIRTLHERQRMNYHSDYAHLIAPGFDGRLAFTFSRQTASLLLAKNEGRFRFTLGGNVETARLHTATPGLISRAQGRTLWLSPYAEVQYRFRKPSINRIELLYFENIVYEKSWTDLLAFPRISGFRKLVLASLAPQTFHVERTVELNYTYYNAFHGFTIRAYAQWLFYSTLPGTEYLQSGEVDVQRTRPLSGNRSIVSYLSISKSLSAFWHAKLENVFSEYRKPYMVQGQRQQFKMRNYQISPSVYTNYKRGFNISISALDDINQYFSSFNDNGLVHLFEIEADLSYAFKKVTLSITPQFRWGTVESPHWQRLHLAASVEWRPTEKMTLQLVGNNVLNMHTDQKRTLAQEDLFSRKLILPNLPGSVMLRGTYTF